MINLKYAPDLNVDQLLFKKGTARTLKILPLRALQKMAIQDE